MFGSSPNFPVDVQWRSAMHMNRGPFHSIEDTLEYLCLLDITIGESHRDLESRVHSAVGERSRSGLLLALYKLSQLSDCVRQSKRILNDLSLIRTALTGNGNPEAIPRGKAAVIATRSRSHDPAEINSPFSPSILG